MTKPSLLEMLKSLDTSGLIPMHMPGHKRSPELSGDLPYAIDVTEIRGFDDLHDIESGGCIHNICHLAEEAYGIPERDGGSLAAYPLVGGSTVGILAAIRAAATQFRRHGIEPKLLMTRNCHKSVWHAAEITRLEAGYVLPSLDENGIWGGISPHQIDGLMSSDPALKIVVITSPTYEGVISDIKKIGDVVHARGGLLLVDAAHGAHLPFLSPVPSVFDGADAAAVSLHKTLPALTGCAMLLLPSDRLDPTLVARELNVFESSSPSYVLLASIEGALSLAMNESSRFGAYRRRLRTARAELEKLSCLKLWEAGDFDYDEGKLVLAIPRGVVLDGKELFGGALADLFRAEGIEVEMASAKHIVAMTSAWDMLTAGRDFISPNIDAFVAAARRIDTRLSFDESLCKTSVFDYSLPIVAMPSHAAISSPAKSVPVDDLKGKISACYLWAYPPGIPLVAPGEVFDDSVISTVKNYSQANISLKVQPFCKEGFWVLL